MERKLHIVVFSFILMCPLLAQYSFDFTNTSDTIVIDTLEMKFYFRLENTGTLPDSYTIDCRWVSDSIPGWFELYCAGGLCTWPGIIVYEYLDVGGVDSLIDIQVFPTSDSGMEVLNLHVQSVFEPSLVDSITVYAVYGTPGQYGFDFSCLSDTVMVDTAVVEFQFRLENTGTSSDTYTFDLRVIDSVPGWTESFFVDGVWADPGDQLTEYLGIWVVDTAIYVRVDPEGYGTEVLNLHVESTTNPDLKDSINIYVIAADPGVEEYTDNTHYRPLLQIYPNPFKNKTDIRLQPAPSSGARPGITDMGNNVELKIYDISGCLVKQLLLTTPNSLFPTVVSWDGKNDMDRKLPTGVYFIRLVSEDFILTDKAILLR